MDQLSQLAEGAVVVLYAFDDMPEHQFLVHTVLADCLTGIALTGPLMGAYGEPPLEMIKVVLSA